MVATVAGRHDPWVAWVQATAVAALVGGLADWFAVTALFRRPLGLPIPHTAIVVERKDRFGQTLGTFVQESFLTPDAVIERFRAAHALERAATWLATPANAERVGGHAAEALVAGADLVDNDDVHALFDSVVRQRLSRLAVAPLAGRALAQLTREQRHQPVLDAALTGVSRYLEVHGDELHRRFSARTPRPDGRPERRGNWWLPAPVETRVVNRLLERVRTVLAEMAADRSHPLRVQIDEALAELATELEVSPSLRRKGDELRDELLAQPQLRQLGLSLWDDVRGQLHEQAGDPGSPLRMRLADVIARAGARLRDDPDVAASTQRALDAAVTAILGRFDVELAALVSGTISRWDASETSRRLELLLGPDLQYIRINGTVVGGLAGLALHAVTRLAG